MLINLITGGPGPEREGSLASGRDVKRALESLGHEVVVFDLVSPKFLTEVDDCDVAFLTTHGWFGEDGKLQGALDILGIPYLGSGSLASATAMYKPATLRLAHLLGIPHPRWRLLEAGPVKSETTGAIYDELEPCIFIKPASGGGSIGAGIAQSAAELASTIATTQRDQPCVVSEYIRGTDVTIGILEIKGELCCLPPLATYYDAPFYDYDVKHTKNLRRHECPAAIPRETAERLAHHSRKLFQMLLCRGFARFDYIIDRQGREWFLEANTLPGLSEAGNFATMAASYGMSYLQLIDTMLETSRAALSYQP